jgi:signal transduction histidine kinase/CheY-like chemotaxis protein
VTDPQIIVADDWTRNWQASIAVKITAMVLWVVIGVTFAALIAIIWTHENNLRSEFIAETENVAHELQTHINDGIYMDVEHILTFIKAELPQHQFDAIRISLAGQSHLVGSIPGNAVSESHVLEHDGKALEIGGAPVELTTYHRQVRELALEQRRLMMIGVALAVLTFGLFLTWVIKNVLSKPFQVLIDATQMVSAGNLGTRINFTRQDEFGHLSQFFNQMLDRIGQQQTELQNANDELKREITVRMEAEQALLNHRDHLEKVVYERTADLAIARDQALKASQTKSDFIANISHEVRTPLTSIIGFAESILDGGLSAAEKTDAVKTVARNGRHLLTLINDILDLSKMEADRLDIDKLAFSPFQLLSDIESLVGMQAREKGLAFDISYSFPLPRQIFSDPTRLKQILLNLCSNAVKFTERGSVRVNVSCSTPRHKMIFTVVDSGIGLSQAAQERLFKAFSQADSSTTRKFGGTGLGLYISRQLAQKLGGDITVESIEGLGSKFIVAIDTGPLEEIGYVEALEAGMKVHDQSLHGAAIERLQGRVLLAEDSLDNQRLISMYLRRAGLEVAVAENGKLAVEYALANEFDLVLMDMQMPVMDGLEAVRLLRGAGYAQPIVALTANAMKEDQERYLAAGCDDFLSKPIDQQRFFAVLGGRMRVADSPAPNPGLAELMESDEFRQLVQRFVRGLPAQLNDLASAIAEREWEQARMVAHKLKGTGGGFGFPDITRLAADLETTLKRRDLTQVDDRQLALRDEIVRVCVAAGIHLEAWSVAGTSEN